MPDFKRTSAQGYIKKEVESKEVESESNLSEKQKWWI